MATADAKLATTERDNSYGPLRPTLADTQADKWRAARVAAELR